MGHEKLADNARDDGMAVPRSRGMSTFEAALASQWGRVPARRYAQTRIRTHARTRTHTHMSCLRARLPAHNSERRPFTRRVCGARVEVWAARKEPHAPRRSRRGCPRRRRAPCTSRSRATRRRRRASWTRPATRGRSSRPERPQSQPPPPHGPSGWWTKTDCNQRSANESMISSGVVVSGRPLTSVTL